MRVSHACICGSDLWPYKLLEPLNVGRPMGHEAIGVVEAIGAEVRTVKPGDLVVMPFAFSDGTCDFCSMLECVSTDEAILTSIQMARAGGAIGRVGVPHYEAIPAAQPSFYGKAVPDGYRAMNERRALKVMVRL